MTLFCAEAFLFCGDRLFFSLSDVLGGCFYIAYYLGMYVLTGEVGRTYLGGRGGGRRMGEMKGRWEVIWDVTK